MITIDTDQDGQLEIDGGIALSASTTYLMSVEVGNSVDNIDLTELIKDNGEDYLFFFGFTQDAFIAPNGNGNIEDRSDNIVYVDTDINELPVGTQTSWVTAQAQSGFFRVLLKYQPDGQKTEDSSVEVGDTFFDLEWELQIN